MQKYKNAKIQNAKIQNAKITIIANKSVSCNQLHYIF
jgi:hypothetical protein